jgi:hypothetical protein
VSWVHRFMVVPDANAAVARSLVKTIAPPRSADVMWAVGLNASGTGTPTHWISSGMIQDNFAAILGNAPLTYGAYQQAGGTTITLADIQNLYAAATIRSDAQGQEMTILGSMGLKLIGST